MRTIRTLFISTLFATFIYYSAAEAHVGAWHKSMFCLNGLSNDVVEGHRAVSEPIMDQNFWNFWFRGDCKKFPPAKGDFLELPVGGTTTLELAANRAFTDLSYGGRKSTTWPDGDKHPDYEHLPYVPDKCLGPLHTENRTSAAGTVLGRSLVSTARLNPLTTLSAIAYKSNIMDVKYEDLVVISVAANTPWHREQQYEVPKDLPPCNDCICAWSWIPNSCGLTNFCKVTGARADAPKLAKAQKPVWCEDNEGECVKGAKGLTIWLQKEDNTFEFEHKQQKDGKLRSPGYNTKMGFRPGAQTDIYEDSSSPTLPQMPPTSIPQPSCTAKVDGEGGRWKSRRRMRSA
ncbi:hypothetical protein BKA62DRAFT_750627 [Auriculariales sp. MPI-PUGE-AT-0066]|nr:hypothetical protein BKA62DRAFT_750627 [Auriculariales sp. MPI-PUGE-AT-0066]